MYPVVYSYKKTNTRELELSIESLKNIRQWNGKTYIIGDDPGLNVPYIHLPIAYDWGKKSGVKSNDEVCAYLTAADHLHEFIIMADDMYVLHPWDICTYRRGSIDAHLSWRGRRDGYARQLENTGKYLLESGLSTLSFEVHAPMLVRGDQVRLASAIIRDGDPLLIRSLMGNMFSYQSEYIVDPKNIPIRDDTVLYSSLDSTFNYKRVRKYLK